MADQRTPDEIAAEIEALKAGPNPPHGNSAKMRGLRAELRAAEEAEQVRLMRGDPPPAAEARQSKDAETGVVHTWSAGSPGVLAVDWTGRPVQGPSPFDSEEWRFLTKACAEVQLESRGNQTGVVKKFYNELWAKLTVWRLAREIVEQVGIGGTWPQWVTLGRNDSTGEKLPASRQKPAPAPAAPAATNQTAGGMPLRGRAPSREEILKSVAGGDPRAGVLAAVADRGAPGVPPSPGE